MSFFSGEVVKPELCKFNTSKWCYSSNEFYEQGSYQEGAILQEVGFDHVQGNVE
jgi:hypothetical protein